MGALSGVVWGCDGGLPKLRVLLKCPCGLSRAVGVVGIWSASLPTPQILLHDLPRLSLGFRHSNESSVEDLVAAFVIFHCNMVHGLVSIASAKAVAACYCQPGREWA